MRINANGLDINYQIDGPEGAPWLVFSNSLATNLSMWDEQAAELKKSFRVLRYDQRGHGGTQATDGRYNFQQLAADLAALLDALSIKRAHVLGISMGGMTALALAQQYPDHVDRLIPCDCGPASSPASAQQWEERIAIVEKQGMEPLVEVTIGRWFPPEFVQSQPKVIDKVRQMIRTTPPKGFIGCGGALANYDLRPGLGGIKHRTLLIVGTKDATVPGIKLINQSVPGSRVVELEGAGHLSNLEQAQRFTNAVREFLGAS
jgi:3-oxoadipate enol-lactonase